jgi:hypothetical protein
MPFIINLNVSTMKGYLMELSAMGKSRLGGLPSIIIILIRSLIYMNGQGFKAIPWDDDVISKMDNETLDEYIVN